MQSSEKESQNLLRVLILSQLQVFAIDDIQNDKKFFQQSIKQKSKTLCEEIIKQHGTHISKLFEVKEGEFVSNILAIVEELMKIQSELGLDQYGAMLEFARIVKENPHVTMSLEEKDELISKQMGQINELNAIISKGLLATRKLRDKVSAGEYNTDKVDDLLKDVFEVTNTLKFRK